MENTEPMILGIIGGTGKQGRGLALRFAQAGFKVMIGSRKKEKALRISKELNERLGKNTIHGGTNIEIAQQATHLFVTLPYQSREGIIKEIKPVLREDTVIIDVTNALTFKGGEPHVLDNKESAAEELQKWLPEHTVISGFTTLGSRVLEDVSHDLQSTVLLTGDKEACNHFALHIQKIPGLKPIYAGNLKYTRYLEGIAALSINIEKINKTRVNGILFLTETQ